MKDMTQAQKVGYEIDGEVVATLKEVAGLLGVERVTGKDIQEGGQYADLVSLVDLADSDDTGVSASEDGDEEEDGKEASGEEDNWDEGKKLQNPPEEEKHLMEKDDVDTSVIYSTVADDEVDMTPEEVKASMPEFESLDELKEFIKDMDTPTLEYLAKGLKLDWTPTYHANIHRMRIAMTMHRHFFPDQFQPKDAKKKKAKYGDFSTDDLFAMCKEHDIKVTRSNNEPIDRMRAIMELKKGGHLPE